MLIVIILSVRFFCNPYCQYVGCLYAKCCYAECRYAECCDAKALANLSQREETWAEFSTIDGVYVQGNLTEGEGLVQMTS